MIYPQKTPPLVLKKTLSCLMGILPMMASSVMADDVTWTGASDTNFWNSTNWSNNQAPDLDNNLIINNGTIKMLIDNTNHTVNRSNSFGGSLVIGKGSNTNALLDMVLVDNSSSSAHIYGDIKLGVEGGVGTLTLEQNVNHRGDQGSRVEGALSLGAGLNSQGTINLLGQGKQISEQNMSKSLISAIDISVGTNGGKGLLNVDGGSIDIAGSNYDYDNTGYVFSLGSGVGSIGATNVLGGGKLTVSFANNSNSITMDQSAVIGLNGGTGTLTISGSIIGNDGMLAPSRAIFGQGLAIGQGANSIGEININSGGLLRTLSNNNYDGYDPSDPNAVTNTYKIEIGTNGGTGSVIVSGSGSRWEISGNTTISGSSGYGTTGKLDIGNTGNGTLTISDGAIVALGKTISVSGEYIDPNTKNSSYYHDYDFISGGGTLNIAGSADGKGTLNIGSAIGDVAVAAGTLEADNIVFGAGDGQIVFNHTDSDYQFETVLSGKGTITQKAGITWLTGNNATLSGTVQLVGGTLGAANNNALGSANVAVTGSSTLAYADAITLNNVIAIDQGVTLNASAASGTATQEGIISGAGHFEKMDAGTLTLTGKNTLTGEVRAKEGILALSADGSVSEARRVVVDSTFDLTGIHAATAIKSLAGGGMVDLGDKDLIVTAANDTFSGNIKGTGTVSLTGGTLTLTGINDYTGQTTIEEGTLIVQDQYNGQASLASSLVDIQQGGTLGGYGSVAGNVTNAGTILVGSAINNSSDNFGAFTIKGDYIGQGGLVVIGTVLANDTAPSDRLVIEGNASGQGHLLVNNIRGAGAQTDKGIEVIEVQGDSNAHFNLQGRAVAGAYEYDLKQGRDGNWYLRSEIVDGGNVGNGGNGNMGGSRALYRPEVGSYLANIAAVNSLFSHQLNDRVLQSAGADGRNAWVRMVGHHGTFKDSTGQLRTTTNHQVVQVGGDILSQAFAHNGLLKLGAMFGYGHTKSTTRGYQANTRSRSSGDGYALGLYGTWYQNRADLTGAYVDTWLQYVHFDNNVKGNYLRNEDYSAKGIIASIEAGYTFKFAESFYLQPQAQVTWMNVKANAHRESNGTYVRSGGQGNIQTRLGARLFGTFNLSNGINLRPYAELNWLHNTKSYYVDMDGTRINQHGAKNIGQIKAGLSAQITQQLGFWGDLSYDLGKNSYRNTKLSIGLKYTF